MDRLKELTERMRSHGAPRPESWAKSEVDEDIAQEARFLFLRSIWPDMIESSGNGDALRRYPSLARLLDAGADPGDLSRALRAVAYETAFQMLYHVDYGADEKAPSDAPGWRLIEIGPDEKPTGRDVGMLHESLQSLDQSGREALDLFE